MAQDGKDLDVFKRPPDVNKLGVYKKKKKVKVLDEDEYVEKLEKIIERDFFPEIDKLKARSDYIDAADRNDTNEMRRLRERFSTGRMPTDSMSRLSTPATFDTPQTSKDKSDEKEPSKAQASINHPAENTLAKDDNGEDDELKDVTLDTFLSKHTSEDNEAFNDIVEEQREIFVKNHEWMFKNDEQLSLEHKATSLVLPSIENQCSTISTESKPLDGWTYKNVNPVFYNPDGVELSDHEKMEIVKKQRTIHIENTRFKTNPWKLTDKQKEALMVSKQEQELGKVGADGQLLVDSNSTPSVNGYKLLRLDNPSPMINPEESPFMTWGEVESTPFRIEGEEDDIMFQANAGLAGGPSFKIQDIPKRDRIALELAEKNSKFYRDKKNKAIEKARSHMKTPKRGNLTLRVASMSPAAQRLATNKLGIRIGTDDKALKAAYTPSPRTARSSKSTPTPTSLRAKNSSVVRNSSGATPSTPKTPSSVSTPRKEVVDPSNLTDDLLNLPPSTSKTRPRASDFM